MKKIWIVLKSEFIRRVRSVWFIVGTLLAPVMLIAMAVLPAVIGLAASDSEERRIAVLDETGVLFPGLEKYGTEGFLFIASSEPVDSLREAVMMGGYNGYMWLPAGLVNDEGEAVYYSVEGSGLTGEMRLERALSRSLEEHRLAEKNVPQEILDILDTSIPVRTVKLTEQGEEADSAAFYSVLGYIMGFIIYAAMFIYGAYVIQGVLEEKSTRVIEVMVSSVRPFEMLMGKVLGIGAVGLVQMMAWSILMLGATLFAGSIVSLFLNPADLNLPLDASQEQMLQAAEFTIPQIAPRVFIWFVLFFLGGYLLYASLFAAVSSVVEQQQDAQGLLMPIYTLIIIPIMFIMFFVESPNSTLAITLSMIPFFSPILMVVRVAVTEVPFWQVGLSFLLLMGTFVVAMWVSARIYRVGILMYGKKPNLKDLIRWVRYE
ncbi:MAG: ABC transporter permease [Rhodothermales bacterium]|nr:ABC transporter permease [Rhodothermales bacterium]